MAVMMGNLYSALTQAGADEESAKTAVEEVAAYDNRIGDLKTELKTELASIRGELSPVKWMIGFNLAMTVALVVRLFIATH
jgi:hypothetical protein